MNIFKICFQFLVVKKWRNIGSEHNLANPLKTPCLITVNQNKIDVISGENEYQRLDFPKIIIKLTRLR